MNHRSFNVLGNVAIINFHNKFKKSDKVNLANKILKKNSNIKTVLEKSEKFKGRLRKMKTTFLAGEKTKEVLYKENNCTFRFNVDSTYFSPRLSNERKEIASKIKRNSLVLVMFAGVGPFSIIIAKNSQASKVYSNEINKESNKYAKINIELNKVKNKVILVPGDIKKVSKKLIFQGLKFNVIVMPRPKLKETFLKQAFNLSKKGTIIFYYDFCKVDEKDLILKKIKDEAKKYKKKIKILKVKKAGEIGPGKIRMRVDFRVL